MGRGRTAANELEGDVVVSAERLRALAAAILEGVGTAPAAAATVAASLVEANLAGHDSHGVLRLPSYVGFVRTGRVRPEAEPVVRTRQRGVARVDGRWGWGQLAARLAATVATELAHANGVGTVAVSSCNHVGRLGDYVEAIARECLVGHAFANADPAVAAPQGRERLMGTNPIAWALPRGAGAPPLVLDFATAGVAEGKLRIARTRGEQVAAGVLVDRAGEPATDPAAFYDGGALLPFGGHKGYGMSVVIELLGRALADVDAAPSGAAHAGYGTMIWALDIAALQPFDEFVLETDAWCARARASGGPDQRVVLPGDPERATRARRLADGVPVPAATVAELEALAEEVGARLPATEPSPS